MSNTALGAALTIDDSVLAKIQEAEKRILSLEQTTLRSTKNMNQSFLDLGNSGLQNFINKVIQAQNEINKMSVPKLNLGNSLNFSGVNQQATALANNVTKISVAINKIGNVDNQLNPKNSVLAWQGLQKNIEQLEKRQQDLVKVTRDYENTMTRIQSGKGGVLTKNMQDQYKAAQTELATNRQLIESYRQKQQAIVNYQAEQRKQIQNAQTLRNFESQQSSLPEQRKAEELKKMNEYYRELEKVSKRQAEQAAKDAEREATARKKAEEATRRQMEAENRRRANNVDKQNTAALTAYNRAMAASEGTITQRTNKIAKLKQAEEQLSRAQRNSTQEISRIRQEIERLTKENDKQAASYARVQSSQRGLLNTSGQLARKLALIFSVSQIQGYVNKLIQVRGEFELQNTALASILQNKDQADKLFGQITELAVKSPFTVKELTTYTKSLAAYQFQYEELYDTTKRLADVASGLGVDMQRLILAVGQVKAAGYLRGTETRQFTEAGFNILGELAKYYSELENRIVSVGEVQERQFKRMIAFQDVEEVFRRVTDAGGMFYQMQEKQAETLAGQMSNLKDSIDLMFNSIGKANDGTLKDMVALVRSFIENWQEVVFVLEPAVAALGAWKALTLLASIGNKKFALSLYAIATNAKTATASISLMTRATTMLAAVSRGLMSVFAIAIPVALIAGVMELYRVTTKASREANELKKALDGISNEGFVRASELISNFKVLAEKAVEAADGSKEQQAALEELQRTYKDILPERELEIDKLRELKGEYDNITTAIYSKIEAQIKEKQIQEVSNTYGTAASEAMDALAKRLTDYNISLSTAKTITNEFKKMLEQGMIKDANQAKTELENLIRLFSGQYASLGEKNIWQRLGWTTGVDVIDEIDDAFNAFTRFNDEVKRLEGEPITPFRIGGGTEMYQSLKEELENIAKFKEDWEKQNKDKFKFKVEFNEESKNALIAEYQKFIADLNNRISSGQIKQGDILSANLIIEEAQKAIEKLDVSPQIAQVNDLRVEFSKLYDIDFEKFNFTKMLEGQGFNDFIKRLDEGIQGYQEIIDVFDEAAKQGTEVPAMQQWALLQGKTIEEIRAFVPILEEYRAKLALVTKEEDKKKGRDNTEQIFKDRLSFFERANKEYEKLLKNYSEEEARAKVIASMLDEAQQRGVGGIFMSAEFDDQGTLDSLNRVKAMYKSLSDEMRIEFAKAFGGIQLDMDVEIRQDRIKTIQDQFSDLFGNYELSLELDKLGLDKGLMSDLFNVDVFDLSEVQDKIDAAWIEMANKQEQEDAKRENRTAKSFSNVADAIKKFGDKGAEEYAVQQEKITNAHKKQMQDLIKSYAASTETFAQQREKLKKEFDALLGYVLSKEQQIGSGEAKAIANIIENNYKKALNQINWEEFRGSADYGLAFGNLDSVSTGTLKKVYASISKFREAAIRTEDTKNIKEYVSAMQQLYDKILERGNPFENLKITIEQYNNAISNLRQSEEEYKNAQAKYAQSYATATEEQRLVLLNNTKTAYEKLSNATNNYYQSIDNLTKVEQRAEEVFLGFGKNLSSTIGAVMGDDVASQFDAVFDVFDKAEDAINLLNKSTRESIANTVEQVAQAGVDSVDTIGQTVEATNTAIQSSSQAASSAVSLVEKASVILAVISAAIQVYNQIAQVEEENYEAEQEYLQGIISLQIEYNKTLLESKLLHEDVFGSNPFGNIMSDLRTAKDALNKYNEAANEMQKEWQDPESGGFLGKMWKVLAKGFGAFDVLDLGWGDWLVDGVQGMINTVNGVKDSGIVKAIDNLRYITQHGKKGFLGIGAKDTKTQSLQDWVKENLGADLFDKDGLVNLDIVNELLNSHADNLTDDTKATLQELQSYAEIIEEVENNISDWATDVFGDLSSNLSTALIDSFRNGMDAADDFKTHVASVLENLGQQMLQSMLYEQVFSQYQGQLEKLTKKYSLGQLSEAEYMDALASLTGNIIDSSDVFISVGEDFLESLKQAAKDKGYDIFLPDNQGDSMTSLQKGISSISEETAQALEALLNSMRYFVSDSNLQLRTILATLTTPAPENPFLLELKAQTEQLRTMNSLWSRIVKSENGSIALNVRIK